MKNIPFGGTDSKIVIGFKVLLTFKNMFQKLKDFRHKLEILQVGQGDLDLLLSRVEPTWSLDERVYWITDLLMWIRRRSPIAPRIRFLLQVLDSHPDWKLACAQTLRSLIRDMRSVELFCETGLASEPGFIGEFLERIYAKTLPAMPHDGEIGNLFTQIFPSQDDPIWLAQLDEHTGSRLIALLHFGDTTVHASWNNLNSDLEDALILIASQIRAMGLSRMVRTRLKEGRDLELSPFAHLTFLLDEVLSAKDNQRLHDLTINYQQLQDILEACEQAVGNLYSHLDEHGVSVTLVYHIEKLGSQIQRMKKLLAVFLEPNISAPQIFSFVAGLVAENQSRRGLRSLFDQNTELLARKIAESSAETGDHYIARNKSEYRGLVRHALGGGFITGFTTYIKFGVHAFATKGFIEGFLAGLNYAVSFVVIQLCNFSLATKQPAMTAAALTARMHNIENEKAMQELVDEIVRLIRSQVAAIFGNLAMVVPTVLLFNLVYQLLGHQPILNATTAEHTIKSLSIFGMTPLDAAFTGVLLFLSSICAGWLRNWFVFHRLREAFIQNRKLHFLIGKPGARRVGVFLDRNISGFAGNISLGFMLGLAPSIMEFLGLPIEVRHVTLSTGQLSAACAALGIEVFDTPLFWNAIAGIVVIGMMNLGVSFGLAMTVAIRARRVRAPGRRRIYLAVWRRFCSVPFSFFFPFKQKELPIDGNA